MKSILEVIKSIENKDSVSARKKVTILGAGVAGLSAAYELDRLGHQIEIIEASDRIGGRIRTHTFYSGQYHELGAMRIPASHDFTRYYITKFGLKTRPFISHHKTLKTFYYINDICTTIESAKQNLFPSLKLSPSELQIASDKVAPALLEKPFVDLINSLNEEDIKSLFGEGKLTQKIIDCDKYSLGEYLEKYFEGSDTLELVGSTTGLGVWWHKSLLMFIRDEIVGTGVGLEEIEGGMYQLTKSISQGLMRHIRLEHEVTEIHKLNEGVRLVVKNKEGSESEYISDYVICTIPFSVLRRTKLSGLSNGKMLAIRNLNYASSTKVLLHCKERFWEKDNGIIGGASFSDLITRATYYPSDHYNPAEEDEFSRDVSSNATGSERNGKGLFTSYSTTSPDAAKFFATNQEAGPGVLVASYSWGRDAQRLGSIPEKERAEVCIDVISKFHPKIRDYVDDYKTIFWDEEKWSAGAFCFMLPGDLTKYYADIVKPEGQLFFAGEHCSLDQAWIQGAIISALSAVEDILGHS